MGWAEKWVADNSERTSASLTGKDVGIIIGGVLVGYCSVLL